MSNGGSPLTKTSASISFWPLPCNERINQNEAGCTLSYHDTPSMRTNHVLSQYLTR